MNIKRIFSLILMILFSSCVLPGALAEQPESPAISFGYASHHQNGFLYGQSDGSVIWDYDLTTGTCRPLCTREGCTHQPISWIDPDSFDYSALRMMNENDSLCYASRLAFCSLDHGYVMYGNKVYFFPRFYPEPQPGTNMLHLLVSEVDGETRLLADLGPLFPGDCDPEVWDTIAYDGYLYTQVCLYKNPDWEGERISDIQPGTFQIVKCSMTTGEASVLGSFWAEYCQVRFFGLYNGVLYYEVDTANGMEPAETEDDYLRDVRNRTRYSLYGIDIETGETVIPDQRLCNRTLQFGEQFDIVKDGILYSFVLPQSAEDHTALFLGYDLNRRETVLEYPFQYDDQEDFFPYRVLTDEIMLSFNFKAGAFALHNLKTGEISPLSIPGACISGNNGQTDWYDIFMEYFQTDPLILDHCFADNGKVDKGYVTVKELLGGDLQIHEFVGE